MSATPPPASTSARAEHRVFSFGCRLNIAEGEHIASLLRRASGEKALSHETLVVNTCAVTHEAERQVRQKIRRLHREHPHARIVVAGCAAHMNAESYRKMTGVAKVLGNDTKMQASSYAENNTQDDETRAASLLQAAPLPQAASLPQAAPLLQATPLPRGERERRTPLLAPDTEGEPAFPRTRFVLPVQQGCDHCCTFCMIPLARGGARSLSVELACSSVARAVARGVKEVVLSGIDLASWGEDLPDRPLFGKFGRSPVEKKSTPRTLAPLFHRRRGA